MPNPHASESAALNARTSGELASSEQSASKPANIGTNESTATEPSSDSTPSFGSMLSEFERSHTVKRVEGSREGTVVSVSADSVILDVGFKTEGILPLAELQKYRETVKPGDKLQVTIKGRDPEGYYELTLGKAARPTDWAALERAFASKTPIVGTVTAVVKGGLSVDVGVRAFMPASRSGARDAAEMEKLVEQEIRCRITKLDAADEDVVVDRRIVTEEEEQAAKDRRYSEVKEGNTVFGTVRSLTDYGAFVDIGGVDALLHVGDISWSRINKPADVLTVDQQVEVKVLKIDAEKRRVSVGMKQLLPQPWDSVPSKYKVGERVRGTVTRVTDFGAFIELESGVEGLIHVSEMSWVKKNVAPSKIVVPGTEVEVQVLEVDSNKRRISLGLKQTQDNPWEAFVRDHPVGSSIEGEIKSITEFGLFIGLGGEIDGMVHLSDLSWSKGGDEAIKDYEKGQVVSAKVLDVDAEKERVSLGIKQLGDDPIEKAGAGGGALKKNQVITATVTEVNDGGIEVQLADGIKSFIRRSDLARDRNDQRPERFQTGNKVDVLVTQVDKSSRKVSVSIKAREIAEEKEAVAQYGSSDSGASLGDILGAALKKRGGKKGEKDEE